MSELEDQAAQLVEAAKKAGADAADAIVVTSSSTSITVSGGELEAAENSESTDFGLRVLLGQRQACISSSRADAATFAEMAARAVTIAREAPEDPHCGLLDADAVDAVALDLDLVDPAPPLSPDELKEQALAAEAAGLAVPSVGQVEAADAAAGGLEIALAASNGFRGTYRRSATSISVSAIAGEGLGRERDWAAEMRRHRADLPSAEEVGRLAGERAAERLAPRRPPSGAYPVLYDLRVAPGFLRHLLSALNGSSVARGSSWLRDRMGEQVLPEGIDVIDDPLIPRGMASAPFDAEGVAGRARTLVAGGVLQSWVLDAATARKLGLATTGHARRGTGSPPSPGITNIRMTQGVKSREALIRDMGTGLIVTSMIGSSINPTTGAYSRGASGFWVENGEIAYPVNEITVAGNLPEAMLGLIPANDAESHRAVSAPSLLVEGMTIGA